MAVHLWPLPPSMLLALAMGSVALAAPAPASVTGEPDASWSCEALGAEYNAVSSQIQAAEASRARAEEARRKQRKTRALFGMAGGLLPAPKVTAPPGSADEAAAERLDLLQQVYRDKGC